MNSLEKNVQRKKATV